MLRDRAYGYFIEKDYNCAESTLRMINDEYGLGLQDEDFKLVGGYGAGFGCGITCGALAAGVAAIGKMAITGRAHATKDFGPLCGEYVEAFRKKLGDINCTEIKKTYRRDDVRCLRAVEAAADVFEEFVNAHGLAKKA